MKNINSFKLAILYSLMDPPKCLMVGVCYESDGVTLKQACFINVGEGDLVGLLGGKSNIDIKDLARLIAMQRPGMISIGGCGFHYLRNEHDPELWINREGEAPLHITFSYSYMDTSVCPP